MELLLTPAELAKALGFSVQTIYNRLHDPKRGPLPPGNPPIFSSKRQ